MFSEKLGEIVYSRSAHGFGKQLVYLRSVPFVESDRIRIIDKFAYNTALTAVVKYVLENVCFVVVLAPFVYDVIADVKGPRPNLLDESALKKWLLGFKWTTTSTSKLSSFILKRVDLKLNENQSLKGGLNKCWFLF